jgi:hypothetical protein
MVSVQVESLQVALGGIVSEEIVHEAIAVEKFELMKRKEEEEACTVEVRE